MNTLFTFLSVFSLTFLVACETPADENNNRRDSGVDSGEEDSGHNTNQDAGQNDAGQTDAGQNDAGQTDGGDTLPDVSGQPYEGVNEEGVSCGEENPVTCEVGDICCVGVSFAGGGSLTAACSAADACGGLTGFPFRCDDQADCAKGQLCCVELNIGELSAESSCTESECPQGQYPACVNDAECAEGSLCCTPSIASLGFGNLPLDMGVCVETDDCANVNFTGGN